MATNTGPDIITNGLVLCLDAGDRNSYAGSGNTWYDLSGNGNNGGLINGVGYNNSNGGSFSFDGANDYVNCGVIGNTNTSSYEIWFKISTIPTDFRVLFSDNNTKAGLGFYLGTGFILCSDSNNVGQRISNLDNLKTSSWNQTIVVYNNAVPSCFINGIETTYQVNTNYWTNTTNSFEIGRRSTGSYFNNLISNVRIYNRALTSSEIRQNFEATKGRFGL